MTSVLHTLRMDFGVDIEAMERYILTLKWVFGYLQGHAIGER